jgi:hypothetical protein
MTMMAGPGKTIMHIPISTTVPPTIATAHWRNSLNVMPKSPDMPTPV